MTGETEREVKKRENKLRRMHSLANSHKEWIALCDKMNSGDSCIFWNYDGSISIGPRGRVAERIKAEEESHSPEGE